MKNKILALGIVLTAMPGIAKAQWSLERCIDYAMEHNIQLKQQENIGLQKEIAVSTAKNAGLPDLSMGASESFSFGRGLTADNTYTNKSTNSTAFQLTTSVPLFTGMRISNRLKQARMEYDAATADLEKARNDIRIEIAKYYMQAVYGHELVSVAARQVEIDSLQTERLKKMLDAGKASRAEVSRQEATLAQSKMTLAQADIDSRNAVLGLRLLLELQEDKDFGIVMPKTVSENLLSAPLPLAESVYEQALAVKPEIQGEMLRLKVAEKNVAIAKSELYPQIYLSGSVGTNYYKTSGIAMDGFGKQLKNNFNQGLALSVNIPIFNRFQTRNNIKSARIDVDNQKYAIENTKRKLYNEVQQVCFNTIAAKSKYEGAIVAARSSNDAFTLTKAKYENGKANITEFNEAKNSMLKAESDLSRAKYEYVYQIALVDFYCGKPLKVEF